MRVETISPDTVARRGRGRPPNPELTMRRRREILAMAAKLFARRGYAKADLALVAERLDCAKGTLYRYFSTKEDLFIAVLNDGFERLNEGITAAVDGAADARASVRAAIRSCLGFFDENPEYVELLIQERTYFRDRSEPVYDRITRQYTGHRRALFEKLVKGRRSLRDFTRAHAIAAALMNGLLFNTRYGKKTARLVEWTDDVLAAISGTIGRAARRAGRAAVIALSLAMGPAAGAPAAEQANLEDVVVRLLRESSAIKLLAREMVKADSAHVQSRERYAPTLNIEGGYRNATMPATGMAAFTGNEQYQWDLATSVSKSFMTGTNVSVSLSESLFDANDPAIGAPGTGFYKPEDPAFHAPVLSLTLRQSVLRNAFGYGDRKTDRTLESMTEIQRRELAHNASGLAMKILSVYWRVGTMKSSLRHAEQELAESRKLLEIATENVRYGKAESHDLHQFRALVLVSETRVAMAEQSVRDAGREFRRETRLAPETRLIGVTDLVEEKPGLDREEAVRTALQRHPEYLNAKLKLAAAELDLKRQKNDVLPDVSLMAGVSSAASRESFGDGMDDVSSAAYPAWSVGFAVSYPLFNPGAKARVRDSWLVRDQAKLNLDRVREEVRDGVLSALEGVELAHTVLGKTREVRVQAEAYYAALVTNSEQGKLGAYQIKQALDGLTEARQGEREALAGFNLALLAYRRARGEFFEHYGISLEDLLRRVAS